MCCAWHWQSRTTLGLDADNLWTAAGPYHLQSQPMTVISPLCSSRADCLVDGDSFFPVTHGRYDKANPKNACGSQVRSWAKASSVS